jgi:CelD/BcsL family acetyltransferase involved in cellulose biosynthesis
MSEPFSVAVLSPDQLGESERLAWRQLRRSSFQLESPYFDIRYTIAAGSVVPGALVAVLHRRGRVIGFFPFQRRGGAIQPLGAPLTDYQGVIAAPDEVIDLKRLVSALGARVFRFSGLRSRSGRRPLGSVARATMVAHLGAGFDAYLSKRQARHSRFFKRKRRLARALEREVGPVRFAWSREDARVLDYVVRLKRAQYRRTGRHDIFACGWTRALLHRLYEAREPDFGLGFATLSAGSTLLSAEIGLRSGPAYHLWLPVYDRAYARYGPGMLMTIESLRALAGEGVAKVDFGRADADYKAYFADPGEPVLEGSLRPDGALTPLAALASADGAFKGCGALAERARRRMDVIAACETDIKGWCNGAAVAVAALARGKAG